jgi:thiamine biosynthesis lipoprotein
MKIFPFIWFSSIVFSVLYSCHQDIPRLVKFTGETQGTYYAVTYFSSDGKSYQTEVDSILKVVDQSVSMWAPNSLLSRINRNETGVIPDVILTDLVKRSGEIFEETGGAFDPTVGPLVNAWGFGFSGKMKMDQHIVDSLLPLVGYQKITLDRSIQKSDPRIQLDFNAIAQGYSVDLIGHFLEEKGIKNYLVDIGGEVTGKGIKPEGENWKVGIEKPTDNASYGQGLKAIVRLHNRALATSGNYRKFYEENGIRYSHTIDPETGYPVKHSLLSVTVLAENCTDADAYATAFMVMGLEKSKEFLKSRNDLQGYFIFNDEGGTLQTYSTDKFREIIEEEIK